MTTWSKRSLIKYTMHVTVGRTQCAFSEFMFHFSLGLYLIYYKCQVWFAEMKKTINMDPIMITWEAQDALRTAVMSLHCTSNRSLGGESITTWICSCCVYNEEKIGLSVNSCCLHWRFFRLLNGLCRDGCWWCSSDLHQCGCSQN